MMRVIEYTIGSTVKRIIIEAHLSVSDDDIVELALQHAGETRGRLFGVHLERYGSTATVTMYTD